MAAIFAAKGGRARPRSSSARATAAARFSSAAADAATCCRCTSTNLASSRIRRRNLLHRMLRAWPLREQIAFFENELRLPLVEEAESSKLFPMSNKARDVRDGLLAYATRAGATLRMNTVVTGFSPLDGGWRVECDGAPPIDADAVIVATGGLSVPTTGSDGLGLRELARLGHTVHPVYAALTPITAADSPFAELSGVSLRVTLSARDDAAKRAATATGGFLFTHQGYSGPSVLDVSHVVDALARRVARVGASHGAVDGARRRRVGGGVAPTGEPNGDRCVARVAAGPSRGGAADVGECRLRRVRSPSFGVEERVRLIETLVSGELPWTGDEGYRKAEVTGGGVSLAEVHAQTMESQAASGTPHLRRSARRIRSGGRLQLFLGVGDGARGGTRRERREGPGMTRLRRPMHDLAP